MLFTYLQSYPILVGWARVVNMFVDEQKQRKFQIRREYPKGADKK